MAQQSQDFRQLDTINRQETSFHWDNDESDIPYYLQGDQRFESQVMRQLRERIKYAPDIRNAINRFWFLVRKNSMGRVEKKPYCDLCMRISKLLLPDFEEKQALKVVEEDWEADSQGADSLDFNLFYNALYQLTDMWTDEIDAVQYAEFLKKIFRRITTKRYVNRVGAVTKKLPQIKLVFPDQQITGEWENASDNESEHSDYEYKYERNQETGKKQKFRKYVPKLRNHDEIIYDEVIESDWEEFGDMYEMELADLDDVVPFGQIAQDYINMLRTGEEQKSQEQSENEESEKEDVQESNKEEIKIEIAQDPKPVVNPFQALQSFTKATDSYLLSKVILQTVNKHSVQLHISNSTQEKLQSFVTNQSKDISLVRTTIKQQAGEYSAVSHLQRQNSLYKLQMQFVQSDQNTPVFSQTQKITPSSQSPTGNYGWFRKTFLQNKYQTLQRRESRKQTQITLKKVENIKKQDTIKEESPVAAFKPLFSSEDQIRKDPVNAENELVKLANRETTKILILGKPRLGKTTLIKELAERLDLVHVNSLFIVNEILEKSLKHIQDLEEWDEEENGPKPDPLTEFERSIVNKLYSGYDLNNEDQIKLIENKLNSDLVNFKGFILDIPLQQDYASLLNTIQFTVIIQLDISDQNLWRQIEGLKVDPKTNNLYSKRDIATNLLILKKQSELEQSEMEEEEKLEFKPQDFLERVEDQKETLEDEIQKYSQQQNTLFKDLMKKVPRTRRIKVECSGLSTQQRAQIILADLLDLVQPKMILKDLEPESGYRELLLQDIEENEEVRSWTQWGQIDPVELKRGKVIQGSPEYPVQFENKVFVFYTEENQKEFRKNPKKFLMQAPKLPEDYKLAIIGPAKSGKQTQAKLLMQRYAWQIIDADHSINESIETQKLQTEPKPSNPLVGLVQHSQSEFDSLLQGKGTDSKLLNPIILHMQGQQLIKRPPRPPTPDSNEEEQQEEEKEVQELPPEAIREDTQENQETEENEEEQPIVYEDLNLDEIVADPESNELKGFIMIHYPNTEEEIQELKANRVLFDKIIYLTDPTDGKILTERKAYLDTVVSQSIEKSEQSAQFFREIYGEENVIEIPIEGSAQEIHDKIVKAIDPFIKKVDDDEVALSRQDLEGRAWKQYGEYGKFDPVVYSNDYWLMPGLEDIECAINEHFYRFCGELELEDFKKNTYKYSLSKIMRVPPPQIMLMGVSGSGVTTQISILSQKYKIQIFRLYQQFEKSINDERQKRVHFRMLRRGFKVPELEDNEDDEIILPDPYQDEELWEEDPEFQFEQHEFSTMRKILDGNTPQFIYGNWNEEGITQSKLIDLLFEGRRLPNVVVILKIDEQIMINRLLDTQRIEKEHQRLIDEKRQEIREAKELERQERIDNGEEIDEEEEEEEEEEQLDVVSLEEMLEEESDRLKQRLEQQQKFLEDFAQELEEKGIRVIWIDSKFSIQRVTQNIEFELRDWLKNRQNIIESQIPISITNEKAMELHQKKKAILSIFQWNSPVSPNSLPITQDYPVLYRDKLYFPKSEEERNEFIQKPLKYTKRVESHPWDLNLFPNCAVVGLPKSGVSTLCSYLEQKLNIVKVSLPDAVKMILLIESDLQQEILQTLNRGKQLSEELISQVINWRLKQSDCVRKGWVLENYPRNPQDAMLLAQQGHFPHPVFYIDQDLQQTMQRVDSSDFDEKKSILLKQYRYMQSSMTELVSWLSLNYDNVRYLDSYKSKWWVRDTAVNHINKVFEAKRKYAIAHIQKAPVLISQLPITRSEINSKLGRYYRYSPCDWKFKGHLVQVKSNDFVVEYKGAFYFFQNEEQANAFLDTPKQFIMHRELPKDLPRKLTNMEAGQVNLENVQIDGYCPVELISTGNLEDGNPVILVTYKEQIFSCSTIRNCERFLTNPWKYSKAELPVKIPCQPTDINNELFRQLENTLTFIEQNLANPIIRSLIEIGTTRLIFPNESCKSSGLKHLAILLKYYNPLNNNYRTKKYRKRLEQYKIECNTENWLIEQGFKDLKGWEYERYLRTGQKYDLLTKIIEEQGSKYFQKFIR